MHLITHNRYFTFAIALILLQQGLVGLSTYWIGKAGMAIGNDSRQSIAYIEIFFAAIMAAYILGSAALWCQTKLSNSAWRNYYVNVYQTIVTDYKLSTAQNKNATQSWLGSEAQPTINEASSAFIECVSLCCNVVFTLIAFFVLFGSVLSGIILVALLCAGAATLLLRQRIAVLAQRMQCQKQSALAAIGQVWDHSFYGDTTMASRARRSVEERLHDYFSSTQRYKLLEQGIACLPVLLAIPALFLATRHQVLSGHVMIGVVVATLPRSLQLFQNIHAVSMRSGHFLLLIHKIFNLNRFIDGLERVDIFQGIDQQRIKIRAVVPRHRGGAVYGNRILVEGPNGAGKSSLLKQLKSRHPDAIMLGPRIELGSDAQTGSSGQCQLRTLQSILPGRHRILLLDEWDANLDVESVTKIDRWLDELAQFNLIVEVRHR